jgi:hypothetical protein
MPECKRCCVFYRSGSYYSHRRSDTHRDTLAHNQDRFGALTVRCKICEEPYPTGGYSEHAQWEQHVRLTKAGSRRLLRGIALATYANRLRRISAAVMSGVTMAEVGRQFGITKQRVHQIAKDARIKKPIYVRRIPATRCYLCDEAFTSWSDHAIGPEHIRRRDEIGNFIRKYRPS